MSQRKHKTGKERIKHVECCTKDCRENYFDHPAFKIQMPLAGTPQQFAVFSNSQTNVSTIIGRDESCASHR